MGAPPARMQNLKPNASAVRQLNPMAMNPLAAFVRLFVNTFGITRPTPEQEQRAGKLIAAMLAGVLVLVLLVAWALHLAFLR